MLGTSGGKFGSFIVALHSGRLKGSIPIAKRYEDPRHQSGHTKIIAQYNIFSKSFDSVQDKPALSRVEGFDTGLWGGRIK